MNIVKSRNKSEPFLNKPLHFSNYVLLFLIVAILSSVFIFELFSSKLSLAGEPVTLKVIGLSDDPTSTQSKTWTWSSDDENATYRYAINQDKVYVFKQEDKYNFIKTVTQSSGDGTYYIHVQATNPKGQESDVVSVSAVLDNTAPVISGLSDDETPAQSKTWKWSSDDKDATYRYVINQNKTHAFKDEPYDSITTATQSSGDGTYYIHVQSRDVAENASLVITVSALLSNTVPQITGLSDDSTPAKSKTWKWSSDDENATYRYVINQNETHIFKDEPYDSIATATQPSGDGTYYIHVQAQNINGGESEVISVYAILDNTMPTINTLGSSPVSVYQYYRYVDSGATAIDYINGDLTKSIITTNNLNTSIIGSYIYTYVVSDMAGNTSTSTRTVNVVSQPTGGGGTTSIINTGSTKTSVDSKTTDSANINTKTSVDAKIISGEANKTSEVGKTNDIKQSSTSYNLNIGSLIKLPDSPTIYLLDKDNIKRPYVDQGVWNSYFGKDFSSVKIVDKKEIFNYHVGSPVLHKTDTLIKIPDSPKVYKVTENGVLRWVVSEQVAERLYGTSWNKIIYDISDTFFNDYTIGDNIE